MNFLRHRLSRLPIVVIGAIAWLAISNHCALAGLEGAARMPMPSCHDAAPADHAPARHGHESGVECCKVLRATLLTFSSKLTDYDSLACAADDYGVALVSAAEQLRLSPLIEWDTGPPGAESFAESVLQQSLLAHAPPSFA